MALLLQNLAPDVIFSIFARCDIYSVVSASQTCRYLHDLAFDKSVWLTLLDNLRRRSILDRTSNLETLSVAEMIGIVRRLITGPQTWSPGELDHHPVAEVSKTITLHPEIHPGYTDVRLLPSGCYVLFENQGTLGCWSVVHDRLVWRHTSRLEHGTIARFAVEETDPDSAIVMICFCADQPNDRRGIIFIEIVNVDFMTGTHNCLLAAPAPRSRFIDSPVICGPLAAVRLDWDYMVINWRAKSYFIIRGDTRITFALIPRHIVVLDRPSTENPTSISSQMTQSEPSSLQPWTTLPNFLRFQWRKCRNSIHSMPSAPH
ncbi:hypothetical protein C8R45DRAFT_411401 [Mycena sanguinolenta]|nr:hypothetical protein C8R45DRAFT_411401 [Mycena sanguinolenta]